MRLAWLTGVAMIVTGCGGPQLLPTTLFHSPLQASAEPSASDWARLLAASPLDGVDEVRITAHVDGAEWAAWATRADGVGALVLVERTPLGLEAQAFGVHRGAAIRPTIRVLTFEPARVIIVESSISPESTERDAWLYVVERGHIVPLTIDDGTATLRVRAERSAPLERGWCRASTFTATFEASGRELVVHEHASVRELAPERPELAARGTYEVERARHLRWSAGALRSDRPSLVDEPD